MGAVTDFDLAALYDDTKSLDEGALRRVASYSMDGWYGRIFAGSGCFDMDKPIRKYTKRNCRTLLYKEPTKIKVEGINLTFEGLVPKIQKSMLVKDVDAMQPHIRAFVERGHARSRPARTARAPGWSPEGAVLEDRRRHHRRRLRDADQRPRDLGAWGSTSRRWRRCSTALGETARVVRGDRAGLPLAGAALRDAVRGRGPARRGVNPPPRLLAHRCHLRL